MRLPRWDPAGSSIAPEGGACWACRSSCPPCPFWRSPARPLIAIAGVLLWGAAGGVLDSTIKALVADLVPAPRRATAYGVFAAVQGAAAIGGGVMAGALYERSLPILIAAVAATQVIALVLADRNLASASKESRPNRLRRRVTKETEKLHQSSPRSASSR